METRGIAVRTWRIEIPGLKLPTLNAVERWHWGRRAREVKRVRDLVALAAAVAGYARDGPTPRARVTITAWGKYSRRDADSTWWKDIIDALVARPVTVIGGTKVRRWGLIVDDRPAVIGHARCATKEAPTFSVVIVVEDLERT